MASKSGKHLAEVGSVGSALTADRSPSRVRTGPISDSEAAARRQRVLQVASELFLQQGYSGTSIDEIARRSRVGKATIYAECGSKQDMFREFYTSSLTPFRGNLRQAIELGGSLDQVVRQVVRDVLRTNEDRYAVGLLRLAIAESERFPEIAVFALENGAQAMRPFALFLRDQVGHDNMSDKEAARYTLHLFNMALGGSAVLLTDADSFYGDKEGWIESVSRIFLEGIQRIALPDACG